MENIVSWRPAREGSLPQLGTPSLLTYPEYSLNAFQSYSQSIHSVKHSAAIFLQPGRCKRSD